MFCLSWIYMAESHTIRYEKRKLFESRIQKQCILVLCLQLLAKSSSLPLKLVLFWTFHICKTTKNKLARRRSHWEGSCIWLKVCVVNNLLDIVVHFMTSPRVMSKFFSDFSIQYQEMKQAKDVNVKLYCSYSRWLIESTLALRRKSIWIKRNTQLDCRYKSGISFVCHCIAGQVAEGRGSNINPDVFGKITVIYFCKEFRFSLQTLRWNSKGKRALFSGGCCSEQRQKYNQRRTPKTQRCV